MHQQQPARTGRVMLAASLATGAAGSWQDRGMTDSFPRQQARTRRFSLGVPRSFRVSPDGRRVAFLRSKAGADPLTCLWQLHVAGGPGETAHEELVADPAALDAAGDDLPAAEKARRERAREQAGGIVGYRHRQ